MEELSFFHVNVTAVTHQLSLVRRSLLSSVSDYTRASWRAANAKRAVHADDREGRGHWGELFSIEAPNSHAEFHTKQETKRTLSVGCCRSASLAVRFRHPIRWRGKQELFTNHNLRLTRNIKITRISNITVRFVNFNFRRYLRAWLTC